MICDDCNADAFGGESPEMREIKENERYRNAFYTIDAYRARRDFVLDEIVPAGAVPAEPGSAGAYTVLITGWYGTETVGDKAILGQIINETRAADESARISVTSAYPFVTERTLKELGETGKVEIVPLFDKAALRAAASADLVIMGGGPLMEMEWLSVPLWLFFVAKRAGGKTAVHGCGIGPLRTEKGEKAVAELLSLTDEATFRDSASAAAAARLSGKSDMAVTGDPAVKYLQNKFGRIHAGCKSGILACFLRELTAEYFHGAEGAFEAFRLEFERALAVNIKRLCEARGLRPRFCAMHNFVVGGDDRDFNYRFADAHFEKGDCDIDNGLTGIDAVADAMKGAELCLCMRFHSTVFADTLGAPYISIDYTGGGKTVLICSFQTQEARAILENNGLVCGVDFIGAADLIQTVDETETVTCATLYKERKVIVFGTGYNCGKLLLRNPHLNVAYFIDGDAAKHGDRFYNAGIYPPEHVLCEEKGTFVIIGTPGADP
jgi:hypothetical protein